MLGNNMFTYCLNNPIMLLDHSGYDAVVLFDKDGTGHIGLLLQDDNGQWWHFYWGPNGTIAKILCAFGVPVPPETWCVEYEGDPYSLDEINASGQYGDAKYEDSYYMEGNFSKVVDDYKNISGQYFLYVRNCSQVSLGILSTAETNHKATLEYTASFVLPSVAFHNLVYYSQYYRPGRGTHAPRHSASITPDFVLYD